MSGPSAPVLFTRPLVEYDKITFWWRTPVSDGDGSGISSYTLSCSSPPITEIINRSFNSACIRNLSAGTEYPFTLTAFNSNGFSSPASSYPTVVPGLPPSTVTNVQAYWLSTGTDAIVTWSTPTSDGNSPIRFNRIICNPFSGGTLQPSFVRKFATYPSETSRYVYGLSSIFDYNVIVQAQNDVNVSPSNTSFSSMNSWEVSPATQLSTIVSTLRFYMSEFRNPSFYTYNLDGDSRYIIDGGRDMYDNGNFTTPFLRSGVLYTSSGTNNVSPVNYPFAVNYSTLTSTVVDTDFAYAGLGYIQSTTVQLSTFHPLTVLGTRTTVGQPCGWQTGGNAGADGAGSLVTNFLYSNSTINTFTTYAYYRQIFGAGDPSICDLYILLGHPRWGSVFGNTVSTFSSNSTDGCGGFLYTAGPSTKNILAIKTLLSKSAGVSTLTTEVATVVQNFITRIKQAVNF